MTANGHVETIHRAIDLPVQWDTAAKDQLFLQRESLRILEDTNPCGQRYHLAGDSDSSSIAVTYKHKLNLLAFGSGSFSLPITIVGIPCSVSSSGCLFSPPTQETLIHHLHGIPGAKLVLNTADLPVAGFKKGATLPTCQLTNRWTDFPTYLSDMRSHYRHRIKQAQSRWAPVQESIVEQGDFREDLHKLYENVFNRSRYKLEKLGVDFFRKFPADIVKFSANGKSIAFVQTAYNNTQLVFMFAGMDYSTGKQYDTYLNILLYIIRKGIETGCPSIDLGQTAEEIKCKMGGTLMSRHLHIAHSGKVGNLILQSLSGMLSYKQRNHEYHVFKQSQS